ncbi:MAG: hypothetical protein ACE5QF_09515 [Thermoplasmata archaeon]
MRKRSKTDSILSYLMERANTPVELADMSSDLGFDGKVVATIASRLASRGYIQKVRRGVYAYEEESAITKAEVETICTSLAESVERTLGRSLMKKMGIAPPAPGCSTLEDLEGFLIRLRGAMGTATADDLITVIIRRELPPRGAENLLRKLGV